MKKIFNLLAKIFLLFAVINLWYSMLFPQMSVFLLVSFGLNIISGVAWFSVGKMWERMEDGFKAIEVRLDILKEQVEGKKQKK